MSAGLLSGEHFEHFVKVFQDAASHGHLVVLTGAGVSAESGIPTFRGREGFWSVGSQVYQAQELATNAFFARHPQAVWGWYLYRWSLCQRALANAGHVALAEMSQHCGNRLTLVTQNVDGLHRRAGSPEAQTFEVHGTLDRMRCSAACSRALVPTPTEFLDWERHRLPEAQESHRLHCQQCGAWMRPHVLWFDEYYEEAYFRSDSSADRVASADLLLVVGTSGAASLPVHLVHLAQRRGVPILGIDPEESPWLAGAATAQLRATAATVLPGLMQALRDTPTGS